MPRAALQRRPRRRDALRQRHPLPHDLDDAPARGPQPRQVARLGGVAVALQELRVEPWADNEQSSPDVSPNAEPKAIENSDSAKTADSRAG